MGLPYTPTGSGTTARVAHVSSVNLAAGTKVTITGNHGLILLVDQGVTATGTAAAPTVIDLSAVLSTTAGPGAESTTAGGAGGVPTGRGGGGGAGHGTAGANGGGGVNVATDGGAAGAAYSAGLLTEILEAGEAGGHGSGFNGVNSANPGDGGGALQITACGAISLSANVLINASGGGGKGGAAGAGGGNGGGAGGSGGTILLEASSFSVGGTLVSNGGAGAAGGAAVGGLTGLDGEDWGASCTFNAGTMMNVCNPFDPSTPASTAAKGGTNPSVGTGPGNGGNGAAGGTAPQSGLTALTSGGGAGGGATGLIYLNVPPGAAAPTVASSSPAIRTSHICTTTAAMCTYP